MQTASTAIRRPSQVMSLTRSSSSPPTSPLTCAGSCPWTGAHARGSPLRLPRPWATRRRRSRDLHHQVRQSRLRCCRRVEHPSRLAVCGWACARCSPLFLPSKSRPRGRDRRDNVRVQCIRCGAWTSLASLMRVCLVLASVPDGRGRSALVSRRDSTSSSAPRIGPLPMRSRVTRISKAVFSWKNSL